MAFTDIFSSLFQRSSGEERVAQYVIREHDRGRPLAEILEDRYDKKSTLITSQLPLDQWHAYIDEPTLADAILDRLVHNSYRLNLKGGSMRKHKRSTTTDAHGG